MYDFKMGSGGMMYVQSSRTVGSGNCNIVIDTATVWEAVMLVLLIEGICEMCYWDGVSWQTVPTEFHEWYRYEAVVSCHFRNLKGCNVDITDEKDFSVTVYSSM
jgi:hypothetical protein